MLVTNRPVSYLLNMDTTPNPNPKFRRRAADRPDEVLDAAVQLFMERGFAAARVDDIAAAAGISKGAVYQYFPTKQAIFEALVRRAVGPLVDEAVSASSKRLEDPAKVLAGLVHAIAGRLKDPTRAAVPLLVIAEAATFPELAEYYRKVVIDRAFIAFSALFDEAVARGQFRAIDSAIGLRCVMGPIIANILMARVFGIGLPKGVSADDFVTMHLDIVMNGLLARPNPTGGIGREKQA